MVLGPFRYFLTLLHLARPLMRSTWLMALMACWAGCPAYSFTAIGMILWFDGQTSSQSGALR
ncbi:hypothetical protein ACLBOM_01835 [Escherichia coli]